MKDGLIGFLVGVVVCALLFGLIQRKGKQGETVTDTLRVTDTVRVLLPVARDSVVVRTEVAYLVKYITDTLTRPTGYVSENGDSLTRDSVPVVIPIIQKRYTDSTYTAWVSGYRPSLDSIHVYRQREFVTIKEKQRRWNVGITAGYGVTPKGLQPFVGLGVSWRVF